jgi:hypothetical protein
MNIITLNQSEVSIVFGGVNIPTTLFLPHVLAFLGIYGVVYLNRRYFIWAGAKDTIGNGLRPSASIGTSALVFYGCIVSTNVASNAVGFAVEQAASWVGGCFK